MEGSEEVGTSRTGRALSERGVSRRGTVSRQVRKSSGTPAAGGGCRGILGFWHAALLKDRVAASASRSPGPAGMFSLSGGETWPGMGRAVSPGERHTWSAPAAGSRGRLSVRSEERWLSRLNAGREDAVLRAERESIAGEV